MVSDGKYRPEVGDRVRVVLEGEVRETTTETFVVGDGFWSNVIHPDSEHLVSVEKVEPPVEVFGPGTVVRSKRSGWAYTVGEGGFLSHELGRWVIHRLSNHFTSERYERIELK